jgi:hypothetical protein
MNGSGWEDILAIGAVAELARVPRSGDVLNSGEFSYRQELLAHANASGTIRKLSQVRAIRFKCFASKIRRRRLTP